MKTLAPAFCALGLWCTSAYGVDDRTMVYTIHETPSNPSSDVEFIVKVHLEVYSVIENKGDNGGRVYWNVEMIDLIEVVNGSNNRSWRELSPDVDTSTGRWSTIHADLDDILDSEFDEPPLISGLAPTYGHTGDDLDYEFEAGTAGSSPPYTTTTWATWNFIEENASVALSTGSGDPTDTASN